MMFRSASNPKGNIFIQEFKKFLLFFKIFSFFLLSKDKKCSVMITNLIRISKIFFCLSIFVVYFFADPKTIERWKNMQSLSHHAIFFGQFITLVFCLVNEERNENNQYKIFDIFETIDIDLQYKLLLVIDYADQRKQLFKKLGVSTILLLFVCITTIIIECHERKHLISCIAIKLAENIVYVRCLQLVFYIDLTKMRIDMIASRLNQFLKKEITEPPFKKVYKKLLAMKNVYRQIWEITRHINNCFGLSLLAITSCFCLHFVCKFFSWLRQA